jgi:ABC-type dipeptide/oligopeptide/nickel transport system ATPase component
MDISDNSARDPVRDPGALLDVRDLRIHFRSDEGLVRAVDGVSFQLRPVETLGLVGESGCGKTVSSLAILKLLEVPPAEYRGARSCSRAGTCSKPARRKCAASGARSSP